MNLEMLALRRAQEQLDGGAWKREDRGERAGAATTPCSVCGEDYAAGRGPRGQIPVCPSCRAKGWRSQRCIRCGERPLHHRDYCAGLEKVCGHCRAKVRAERELS